jgi:hypothetical protein
MKTKQKTIFVVMISVALMIATGCATQKGSGFLDDYSGFKKGPRGGADFVYFKEGVDFKAYNKVMMDHVVFYFSKDSKYKGIHPDTLKELSDTFHKAVVEALGDAYPLVDEPGPGVMRVRIAITNVVPSKPALNTITSVVPMGLAISTIKKGVTGTHSFVGQASMEAELLDSLTNERLAAAMDTKAAEKYKVFKGMSKWGHAKDAFKFWAKRLRNWLDEVHGLK